MGSDPAATILGPTKVVIQRSRGAGTKARALSMSEANVTDTNTGKTQKTQITRVVRNPANVDYQRRGVITKGAIIDTPLGQARVTSRPGQSGVVNAVLVEKAE
jgi:small subunit ribosomal protein S8e